MRAQACFKNLATLTDCFEPLARGLAVAIVSSQIAKRLFAFEDRCRSNLFRARRYAATSARYRHCGKLTSIAHAENPCACAQRNARRFRLRMLRGFAVAACYSRSHFASSRAQ